MNSVRFKAALILVLVLIVGTNMNAQPMRAKAHGIFVSSKVQTARRNSLLTAQVTEIQKLKFQIAENKAHFKILMNVEEPDMNAIYSNIDELSILHNQLAKRRLEIIKILAFGRVKSKD